MTCLQILHPGDHPDFLDLPLERPMADWSTSRVVDLPQGLHRHEVRFVQYAGRVYVMKEMPRRYVEREVRILRQLDAMRVPAVEVVGGVFDRGDSCGDESLLITRHLTFSLSVRLLLMDGRMPHLHERVLDAVAGMLVRNHLAGFFWGDCSLANTLFRRDAGALTAYVVDVETGELHPRLSDGQRRTDLEIAIENLGGGLADLVAAGTLSGDVDPVETALGVRQRNDGLWSEITKEEVFGVDEGYRTEQRIRRINEMGFDVEEIEIARTADGDQLRLLPRVVEVGFHRPRLVELTGLHAQENQARRLLSDIARYHIELEQELGLPVAEAMAAVRWYDRVFAPAIAAVPAGMRAKLEAAEIYHQMLEHRWFLSERRGADVGMNEAVASYIVNVLPYAPDEVQLVDNEPTD